MVFVRMFIYAGAIRGNCKQGRGDGWRERIGAFAPCWEHRLSVICWYVCRSASKTPAVNRSKSDIQLRACFIFSLIFSVQDRSTLGKRLVAAQVQLAQREQRLSRFQKAPLFQVNVDWLRTCRYIARFALFAGSKACQNGRKPC